MLRVAINGFGRIGRHALKVAWTPTHQKTMQIVGINDLTDTKTLAHLLCYDTAYPDFSSSVSHDEGHISIDGVPVNAYGLKDPSELPWKDLKVDVVIESTGRFTDAEGAGKHIMAGAKKVVISAPAKGDIKTFVRGVNDNTYSGETIINNASCTTNCLAPVVDVIEKTFGIEKALMSTVHAYTADQNLQDGPHKDLRRARAAAANIVPTTTGAAKATTEVIPQLKGNFDGHAFRVPTITVSLADFTLLLKKNATVDEINGALKDASEGRLKNILGVTNEPLVSSDFIADPRSSIVDLELTRVVGGNLVKIVAWYDNEWGYANRLIEMVSVVGNF